MQCKILQWWNAQCLSDLFSFFIIHVKIQTCKNNLVFFLFNGLMNVDQEGNSSCVILTSKTETFKEISKVKYLSTCFFPGFLQLF